MELYNGVRNPTDERGLGTTVVTYLGSWDIWWFRMERLVLIDDDFGVCVSDAILQTTISSVHFV